MFMLFRGAAGDHMIACRDDGSHVCNDLLHLWTEFCEIRSRALEHLFDIEHELRQAMVKGSGILLLFDKECGKVKILHAHSFFLGCIFQTLPFQHLQSMLFP